MRGKTGTVLIGLIVALLVPWAGVQAQGNERSFAMGITYWPATDSTTPLSAAEARLTPISQNSDVVQMILPWCPEGDITSRERLTIAARETERLGIALDWLADDREGVRCGKTDDWSFEEDSTVQEFVSNAVELVRRYQPDYLVLGVEVDYYAVTSPADFPHFLTSYIQARDSVKAVASETLVGVSFQYSHSLAVSDSSASLFTVMTDVFGNISDFVGVSVYPFQRGIAPEDFNTDYFAHLRKVELPIAIIETGWPGSSGDQQEYTSRLLTASDDVGIRLVVWTSATDIPSSFLRPGTPSWAAEIGLWNIGGVPKPALSVWQYWLARPWSAWRP